MRERSCEAPMVAIWRWKRSTTGATAVIGGRGESGEVEWRRWLQRGTEQRRMDEAAVGTGSDRWRWMIIGNGSVRFVRI